MGEQMFRIEVSEVIEPTDTHHDGVLIRRYMQEVETIDLR